MKTAEHVSVEDNRQKEGFARLSAALVLNILLYPVARKMAACTSDERQIVLVFLAGCLAGAALVILIPVFWRGQPWQAPIAFVLLWWPGWVMFCVAIIIVDYWQG